MTSENTRKIDRWFPIEAVDEAVGTSVGSGRSEKALMTWFASRPIAQARAAVLAALLPDADDGVQRLIDIAVRGHDQDPTERLIDIAVRGRDVLDGDRPVTHERAIEILSDLIANRYQSPPVVLDPFSGRGIIPLEAARFGARAIGTDLSPLATLGGRLLADYPLRDWSEEPALPAGWLERLGSPSELFDASTPRLQVDVEAVLREVGDRLAVRGEVLYPRNEDGSYPWGYLWAVTISCDSCGRRFPLVGSLVLRHPWKKRNDLGQWLRIVRSGDDFAIAVEDGIPSEEPTFASIGSKRGKVGRCTFCHHVHSLDAIKAKGKSGDYLDRPLCAADLRDKGALKLFRELRADEVSAAQEPGDTSLESVGNLSLVPDEEIPPGNNHTVRASGYGYRTYGSIMCRRQALQTALVAQIIREVHQDLLAHGVSAEYAEALAAYAGATLVRRVRQSTRGTPLRGHGKADGSGNNRNQTDHIYASESKVADGFDFFETGPGDGPATWNSVVDTALPAIRSITNRDFVAARPGTFRVASAPTLPLRDATVDLVVTDPPYYNMIDYSDASDILYVWVRRALHDAIPDLFGPSAPALQSKDEEIIVKNGGTDSEHRTVEWYHAQLAKSFAEMRRVLKPGGHLTVVFGHNAHDAWVRLLGALRDAGFVVNSSWPSRTESGGGGVASIRVTVTIGCQVAPPSRPRGLKQQVDQEVREAVVSRVKQWSDDGLALPDQMMAAFGPAMEVYGRYSSVHAPNNDEVEIGHYLELASAAVQEAAALTLGSMPLDRFDPVTRLAVFWQRVWGQQPVEKGEARNMARNGGVEMADIRPLFNEGRDVFRLDLDHRDVDVSESTPMWLLVLALAHRWSTDGAEGAATLLAEAEQSAAIETASDERLWAVAVDLEQRLASSHKTAKALAGITRSRNQIINMTARGARSVGDAVAAKAAQTTLELET